jgi:hypothetical protein
MPSFRLRRRQASSQALVLVLRFPPEKSDRHFQHSANVRADLHLCSKSRRSEIAVRISVSLYFTAANQAGAVGRPKPSILTFRPS